MLFGLIEVEAIFLAYNRSHISTLQEIAPKASTILFFQKLGQIKKILKNKRSLFFHLGQNGNAMLFIF